MQFVHKGDHPGESSIRFLPTIDMDPGNTTCIYSTLHYVAKIAKKQKSNPILIFDQPLYWKSLMIVESEPEESPLKFIVLKLGGLHMLISFLGSIGYTMADSGLCVVLETIFVKNAVVHLLSDKAISRSIRGYLIVDAVLNGLLLTKGLKKSGGGKIRNSKSNTDSEPDPGIKLREDMKDLIEQVMNGGQVENLCNNQIVAREESVLVSQKAELQSSRTAKLWIQCMDMVDILRKFIQAERMGNGPLNLEATSEMLPYFTATGHITNGVHAQAAVNIDNARHIGNQILENMA